MKIYAVTVVERFTKTFLVKAGSATQAYTCVCRHYNEIGDIELGPRDLEEGVVGAPRAIRRFKNMAPDFDATKEEGGAA